MCYISTKSASRLHTILAGDGGRNLAQVGGQGHSVWVWGASPVFSAALTTRRV